MPDPLGTSIATPGFRVSRPSPVAHAIERASLRSRLDQLVESARVVVVVAPAGFGKTSTLNAWASASQRRVAWMSLTTADRRPGNLAHGLASAMEELGIRLGEPDSTSWGMPDSNGRLEDEIRVLVIDDVNLAAAPQARAVLAQFLEQAPPPLRIVLAGRQEPQLGLTRTLATGELGRVGPDDLAFSTAEVELAAIAMGQPLTRERASELHALTKGWPVAVRLALMTWPSLETSLSSAVRIASDADIPQLADYLVENVIDRLPPNLRAFVPRACTCDWLTGRLANELVGNARGPELLERALALGLPLERRGTWRSEPVYRWHPVMAQAGRAILLRRDPDLAIGLNRVAARFLATVEPHEAAHHALRGHDPELAAQLIRTNWLVALLSGDSDLIEGLCGQLPGRWSEDPQILSIRAACRRNAGDRLGAAELSRRASLAADSLDPQERPGFEFTNLIASLFMTDEEEGLAAASAQARLALARDTRLDGALRACCTLLIGWVEIRLRHMQSAVQLLREGVQLCQAEGLDALAGRARANLSYALAFAGDFVSANARLSQTGQDEKSGRWRLTDGAIEAYTRGFIRFWSGDHDGAFAAFREAVEKAGGPASFSQLARIGLVQAALARGDRREIARAEAMLDDLPNKTIQGMPWGHWRTVSRAGILLSRGRPEAAVELLDAQCGDAPFAPAMTVLAAELYWVCDRPAQARTLAAKLSGDFPAYLRASGLVITALCDWLDGSTRTAHALLEEALELGSTLGLARPFHLPDRRLRSLMVEHAARGTRHADFLAGQIAYQRSLVQEEGDTALSGREREILGYLATTSECGIGHGARSAAAESGRSSGTWQPP